MTTSANVSIRLSIQDAETVRVALEKLGTDGAAALKKIETASSHPSTGLTALDKGVAGAKSRLEELGQSLGPVGSMLMGLGPIGVAAAVGLGGAVFVMHEMSKEASALAERAEGIRSFADATGLTTAQVQALTAEGAKFSVSNEQLSAGLQHLSVNLDQAHRAQGSLYEDLQRVNPKLADQVAAAKDVATAYDLIGRAIAQATSANNAAEAAAIARAAFGRNFGGQGALAADVSGQGGPNSLAAAYVAAGKALDDGLLKRLTELARQNIQLEQQTRDIWASMYAEETLDRAHRMDEIMLSLAQHAKELHEATKDESWTDWLTRKITEYGEVLAGAEAYPNPDLAATQEQERRELVADAKRRHGIVGETDTGNYQQKFVASDIKKAVGIPNPDPQGNLFTAQDHLKQLLAVLGGAASPTELFYEKLLQLAVALKNNSSGAINAETQERKLEAQLEKTAKTSQAAARALEFLRDSRALETTSARERLGLASQEEILTARLIELKRQERLANVKAGSPEDLAATQRVQRDAAAAFRQEQIQNSAFKGLAGMAHPDTNAAIDQLATGSLNNLDTTLVSIVNHTEQGAAAWRKFGLSATEAIEQTIVKETILAPIAAAMKALLEGGFSGAGGAAGAGKGIPFAMGGIMTPRGSLPLHFYEGGGIATGPQMAIFGEGRKNEAYVPLPDGRAIPVNLNGGGGSGRPMQVENHFHVHISGARGTKEINDTIDAGMNRAVASAAAMLKSYDQNLTSRMMQNDARGI
jgi:hypothetical protein